MDALSRICSATTNTDELRTLHNELCHPGIARMVHAIRTRNLPYSTDDVKKLIKSCRICSELKPQFFKPGTGSLIKATQPFERLNIDFKGPLPSKNGNRYMLTVIDEFSRFPFAFPCPDLSARSVIRCLCSLFSLFGVPAYVHSDRGSSFMSVQLKEFLRERGVATSRTTPYHPQGNGQCERYNGIIWKNIQLAAATRGCPINHWEDLLPEALYAIRTLLCTATNATPHERFLPFQRRSSVGISLPSWLLRPGPVLLRRFVRHGKNDPLVDEVNLIEANPHYALIKYPDGKESTVSLRDLAPAGDKSTTTTEYIDYLADDRPASRIPGDAPMDSLRVTVTDPTSSQGSHNMPSEMEVDNPTQKRSHSPTDSDPESRSPIRWKKKIFTRQRQENMSCESSDPEAPDPDTELPRRSGRPRRRPNKWRDFFPCD